MKFQLVAPDHDYSSAMMSGCVNGGTVWLDNIAQALRYLGHEAELKSITQFLYQDTDYVIVQSEHIYFQHIVEYREKGGKVIALLSHFISDHPIYASQERVREIAQYLFTPWSGKCVPDDAMFMPHAWNSLNDNESVDFKGRVVFAGNTYSLRDEDWFRSLDIQRVYKTLPKDIPAIYRAADVCVNIHGDFQKGVVSDAYNKTADKPGYQINERFWSILGSGGLLITDWVPQMEKWFFKDELIIAESKEEFYDLVNYYKDHKEEGLKKLDKAIKRVQQEHTYIKRVEGMLKCLTS